MKPRFLLYGVLLALIILPLAACSANTPAPTAVPTSAPKVAPTNAPTTTPTTPPTVAPATATTAPTKEPTKTPVKLPTKEQPTSAKPTETPGAPDTGLAVVGYNTFTDASNYFHVSGEVKNNDQRVLTNMELTIIIKDASGKTLLTDTNNKPVDSVTFSPMLSNLAPGEISPFDYSLDATAGTPDPKSVSVKVTGMNTGDVTRANVEVENTQMVASGTDYYLVTGEIANKGGKPVEVHDLAAALVDQDGKVLAADYSVDYAIDLLPFGDQDNRDLTPFTLTINNPGTEPADYKIYLDAQETDLGTTYPVQVDLTNNYFDNSSSFHIVGTVTNQSSETLTVELVAGLYDKDGIVLDAYTTSSPVNLAPDEVMPYDISSFSNVNYNSDEAKRLDHFTVQVDDYFTFPSAIESVPLKSSGDSAEKDDTNAEWTVTGQVTNTSGKALSSEIVMVQVVDTDGKVIAVNYDWISPSGDSIAAGETGSYKVVVPLEPGIDTSSYTVKTFVKGEVK